MEKGKGPEYFPKALYFVPPHIFGVPDDPEKLVLVMLLLNLLLIKSDKNQETSDNSLMHAAHTHTHTHTHSVLHTCVKSVTPNRWIKRGENDQEQHIEVAH